MGTRVRVLLLGPVDVDADGTLRHVSGMRRKAVLAVLGLSPGHIVGAERLIDLVWDGGPPAAAHNALQRHISYLRIKLDQRDAIVARPPGYVLTGQTDVQEAERLIQQGRDAADPGRAAHLLGSALNLWRGPALADATASGWLGEQADRLTGMWLDATLALADVRLSLGEHAQLVGELGRLARQHPWNEQICRLLMLACYRSGRQSDALLAYHQLRRSLDEELGILPSAALRQLEVAILRQEVDPADMGGPVERAATTLTPATAERPTESAGTVPAQLPVAVPGFVGRRAELARLDALFGQTDQVDMAIAVVSGAPGVGKTTLAVHWGHRVATRFPDGQLYVNLRGFHPSGSALDPGDALCSFLAAFDVPAHRVPAGLDERAALYRSVLAGRRVLVLLDNAGDVEQVRPLLPAAPGCLVLVTSRDQLTALVTAEGADLVALGVLSGDESVELLTRRLGPDRLAGDPDAVRGIVASCARLPLALAVAAATCATNPELPVSAVAARLQDSATILASVSGVDARSDVRSVFSWSYQSLSPAAAQVFRLLGMHPGPDVAAPALSGLCGVPSDGLAPLLAELVRAHLVGRSAEDRYTMHDLLRSYAAELAGAEESQADLTAAAGRLLDHYLHTAMSAAARFNPQREPPAADPLRAGAAPQHFTDRDRAVAWFRDERPVLLALLGMAGRLGLDGHVWRLAWAAQDFLSWEGHWHDQVEAQRAAEAAAARQGELSVQARACSALATANARLQRFGEAERDLHRAAELYSRVGDPGAEAAMHFQLGWMAGQLGQLDRALGHSRCALRLYRAAGDRRGAARALNSVGWDYALLGDYRRALPRCEQAMVRLRELGDVQLEAAATDSVGFVLHHLGEHGRAVAHLRRAATLYRDVGDRYFEADTLNHLGEAYAATGDAAAARAAWGQALEILEGLGHPEAERVSARLAAARPLADR